MAMTTKATGEGEERDQEILFAIVKEMSESMTGAQKIGRAHV